jgi:phage terminase large subunit
VSKGYLCWCWIEEAYEIKNEADFDMIDESIRGYIPPETGLYKQMILTFNPWDKRHWIKARFFDIDDPHVLAKTTNYMCNEWLDAADLAKFERMKVRNPRRFKVAGLGYWGIPEGLVYENWEISSFDVSEIRQKQGVSSAFGLDFGYTTDPSALSAALVD